MADNDRYVFMPKFSITPNKICLYNQVFIRDRQNAELKSINSMRKPQNRFDKTINSKNVVTKKHHNFKISDNAYRTLKKKINWLYYLSKSKNVKTYNGKQIYNFKCAFITLTLPSKQNEATSDITSKYFNQFLTEVRQRTKMVNYVWRLEFQKNGNVHYHIVTDTYLDYLFIRKIWNRVISKGGYVAKYQDRFKNLTLSEYNRLVNKNQKTDFSLIAKRYAQGKKDNWSQPNSVDVRSVTNNKSISNYLSKYFAKDSDHGTICNELDTLENSKSMRLWFCSRSLSKLKTLSNFCEAVDFSASALVDGISKVKKLVCKYVTVYYFDFKNLPVCSKQLLGLLLKRYSVSMEYKPSD